MIHSIPRGCRHLEPCSCWALNLLHWSYVYTQNTFVGIELLTLKYCWSIFIAITFTKLAVRFSKDSSNFNQNLQLFKTKFILVLQLRKIFIYHGVWLLGSNVISNMTASTFTCFGKDLYARNFQKVIGLAYTKIHLDFFLNRYSDATHKKFK